jgi:hypothetical protein
VPDELAHVAVLESRFVECGVNVNQGCLQPEFVCGPILTT